ncbi:MAG: hypothetical protein IBJ11_11870 [Phycisphaerales bacterium]|nr:hypothetical protein [Phycisphaerales bacterium]
MFFRRLFGFAERLETAAERARRLHSAWLTRALTDPQWAAPRIPVRPVSEGGWDEFVRSPGGRDWAERWWDDAIDDTPPADEPEWR